MVFESEEMLEHYMYSRLKALMYEGEHCYRQARYMDGIVDILIETKHNNIILELKKAHITSSHVGQAMKYLNNFGWGNSKCVLIGNDISIRTKNYAKNLGISVYLYSIKSDHPLYVSFDHVTGDYIPLLSRIDKNFILINKPN